MYVKFEWDKSKEELNIRLHQVTFSEAVEAFGDPRGFAVEDAQHSVKEVREYWIGASASGRILTVRFTRRGTTIRIFGAAEWRKFRRIYHEATKDI